MSYAHNDLIINVNKRLYIGWQDIANI